MIQNTHTGLMHPPPVPYRSISIPGRDIAAQEAERGVLLLPCRHLCVCKGCSERQELTLCPLCRHAIAEKLVVYS